MLSTGEEPLWSEEDLMNNLGIPIIGLGAPSAGLCEVDWDDSGYTVHHMCGWRDR